jgi:class 3 adenylate cyclase/CHASE2 domain-containing sensor protein
MHLGEGFFFDLEVAAVARIAPRAAPHDVVVIALDEGSLAHPKLAPLPRALMAPLHGRVLDAVLDAGAKVVGYDLVFAWSGNVVGSDGLIAPDYDQSLLDAIRRGRERIVLAETSRVGVATAYAAVIRAAVDRWALGHVEKFLDSDGVARHVPLMLETVEGDWVPTLAGAMLGRLGRPPGHEPLLLAPRRHPEDFPTYGFADVLQCAASDPTSLGRLFQGKIVLIGTTLSDEDRIASAARFIAPPLSASRVHGSCPPLRLGVSAPGSRTVPGVYLHAAAIEAALAGAGIKEGSPLAMALLGGIAALGAAWSGLRLRPSVLLLAAFGISVLVLFVAALALSQGFWLPVVNTIAVATIAGLLAYGIRFVVEERHRKRIQRAFGHFLSPILVERLMESDQALRLGGESREVSVLFADLSGFTAMSTRVSAEVLMEVTNRYLGIVVSAVESTGGYVDKFIGDAVMAIWGAPVSDREHAAHAAGAALTIVKEVEAQHGRDAALGVAGFSVKIGINSGGAVVGNVGASRRYNYTAVGETVNLAARLESVPSDYGCRIIAGQATAEQAIAAFVTCELDWLKVKGKEEPIAVFEILMTREEADEHVWRYLEEYARALADYRAGRFEQAEKAWLKLEHPLAGRQGDGPPRTMADRAAMLKRKPPEHWDGVWVRTSK